MADNSTILRRKTGGRRGASPGAMTPEKALRLAFGRAGRGLAGLDPRLTAFGMERVSVAGLAAAAPEQALVMTLMRGPDTAGALIVDPAMRTALIEAETMGRLTAAPPEARPPTRIDALIAGTFCDTALALLDEVATELSIAPAISGWQVGEMVSEARMLALILDERPMRLFRLGFAFGEGMRAGTALLAMPIDPPRPPRPADGGAQDGFSRSLEAVVMQSAAEVRAVLGQVNVSLATIGRWAPGALLKLPRETLSQVRLEDIDGAPVARGRLGQMNGMRAVRLDPPGASG